MRFIPFKDCFFEINFLNLEAAWRSSHTIHVLRAFVVPQMVRNVGGVRQRTRS